jgi:hypothetical protein
MIAKVRIDSCFAQLGKTALVSRPTNFETTTTIIVAMLCRRARLVPNRAARAFAPDDDFVTVAKHGLVVWAATLRN